MKQPLAPTLSSHLLREASKFRVYPARADRTLPQKLRENPMFYDFVRMVVERRMTFHPGPEDDFSRVLTKPVLLDEFYCWDLLKAIPSMVDRTIKLSHVTLSGTSGSEFVHLREAAYCYIFGLSQAAIALTRAALEDCVRRKWAKMYGEGAAAQGVLKDWINDLARTRHLSPKARTSAHKVREAARKVLHPSPTEEGQADQAARAPDALAIIEDARAVIMELSDARRGGKSA